MRQVGQELGGLFVKYPHETTHGLALATVSAAPAIAALFRKATRWEPLQSIAGPCLMLPIPLKWRCGRAVASAVGIQQSETISELATGTHTAFIAKNGGRICEGSETPAWLYSQSKSPSEVSGIQAAGLQTAPHHAAAWAATTE
jgi:hypothetical protein